MSKISIFTLILLVSLVLSQKPVPCTTPQQWEARFFQFDEEKALFGRGHYSYDSIYKRERIIDEYTLQNDREAFDTLRLYNQNIEFNFHLRTRICTKSQIQVPWKNFGLPDNATSYGESYIGSSAFPNAFVLATIWGYNYTDSLGTQAFYHGGIYIKSQ